MSYIGIPPFGNTVRSVTNVTATASQTTFNITGGYVIGYVDVFLNGVLLTPSDYTATDGLTVVLNTGASASDEFQAVSYQPVSIANVLPSTGGTVSGNVTVTGTVTADSLTVDTNTLYVDSANNRVGIGTISPSVPLDVNGITRTVNAYSLSYAGVPGSTSAFGAGTISADSNWGMYFKATTGAAVANFAWVNGTGSEYMRIDTSGNVGIGTSSPSSKLEVAGGADSTIRNTASSGSSWFAGTNTSSYILHNASNTPMVFTTNGTERMRIDSSGNVGIGTSSPTTYGDGNTKFAVVSNTSGTADVNIRWGTNAVKGILYCNDVSGAGLGIGSTTNTYFAINTNNTERMRIDSSGNVGIGLTPTTYKFEVTGGDVRTNTAAFLYANTLRLRGSDTYQIYESAASTNLQVGTASGAIIFAPSLTERMRIDSSGNVGVNSTSPTQYATSGKVFNITGTANNSGPATQVMSGSTSNPGAGNYIREVFAIANIPNTATEITRITGTGSNGMGMYIRVTVNGHTSGVGNGTNYKAVRYDGGTVTVTQVETATSGQVPPLTFDTSTNNVLVIKLASAGAAQSFNGVFVVEWFVPIDFSSSTWTVS